MKNIMISIGLVIFAHNVVVAADECLTHNHDLHHTHDTHNVGHQLYDALIETPKEAIVNATVATKDLALTVAHSEAAQDLKQAGKQLVVDAPVKTAHAIKNGALKAADATASGAKTVYDNAIVPPAKAIKNKAQEVADSELVQSAKEKVSDIAHRITEVSANAFNATAKGIKKAYHVAIEKPASAIKKAGYEFAHKNHSCKTCHKPEVYVLVLDTPPLFEKAGLVKSDNSAQADQDKESASKMVMVVPADKTNTMVLGFNYNGSPDTLHANAANQASHEHIHLSEHALTQIAIAYDAIQSELASTT